MTTRRASGKPSGRRQLHYQPGQPWRGAASSLLFPLFARPLSGLWYELETAHLRQFRHFRGGSIAVSHTVVLLRLHLRRLRYRTPALSRIFRAIERRHVRRVSIEIRTRDPKFLLMG